MESKIITFRATGEDKERWRAALERDGRTLSDVCRAALDRLAARVERQKAAE